LRAVSSGNTHLILLANPGEAAREVTLQLASPVDGVLKPVGRGAEVSVRGGAANVKLGSNETAAFQF